jgi:cytochrome c oxidase subunit 2
MSNAASVHGKEVDELMWISMILIFIVQTITQGLLFYFSYKYSGKKGQVATYFSDNNKLEFIWSSIPAIVLAVLIFFGLYSWTDIMFVNEKVEKPIVIEIYAQQFKWTARYSGEDNVLGKANVRLIDGINSLGVDLSDKNAQDDIVTDELHLPKGKRVIFKIRSQDVLHSMYMPHFRAQMNCVPGMTTRFHFVPTITTAEMKAKTNNEKFDYLLLCNKICGASHYNMQIKIVVDTPEEYDRWLAEKKTFAQQNAPKEEEAPKVDSLAAGADSTKEGKDTLKLAASAAPMPK